MKTIFLFIRNAILMSDLLRTDYIKYLSQKYRVVVFTPFLGEEEARMGNYFASTNVIYKKWNGKNVKTLAKFKFLRTACMRELNFVSSIDIFYSSDRFLKDKRARLARFLSGPLAPLMTNDFFTKLESFFVRVPPEFKQYCETYKPSLVITATPGIQLYEAEAIILAKKMGLKTLATNFSWDNLMSFKSSRLRRPDYLFCWNDIIRESALKIHGFNPARVFVAGSMRFDRYFKESDVLPGREEFLRGKNLDPRHPTVLFATASKNLNFNLTILRDLLALRSAGEIPYSNILLRLHPIDDPKTYKEFKKEPDFCIEEAGRKITTPTGGEVVEMRREDFVNLKATLAHTEINVNFKSTISLESFLLGKPVINYLDLTQPLLNKIYYDEHSYYRPIVKEGAVRISKNKDDLKAMINDYLADPSLDEAARERVAKKYIPFRDGLSFKRNVDLIEKII